MVPFVQLGRKKNGSQPIQIVAGYIMCHIVEHIIQSWIDIHQQHGQLRVPGLPDDQNIGDTVATVDIFQHTKHSMVNVLDDL
jgi:hypothetical protein